MLGGFVGRGSVHWWSRRRARDGAAQGTLAAPHPAWHALPSLCLTSQDRRPAPNLHHHRTVSFIFPQMTYAAQGPQGSPSGRTSAWRGDAPRGPACSGPEPPPDERMRGPVPPRCGHHCPAPALPGPPAAVAAPGPAPLAAAAARSLPSCLRAHSFRVDQSPHVRFLEGKRQTGGGSLGCPTDPDLGPTATGHSPSPGYGSRQLSFPLSACSFSRLWVTEHRTRPEDGNAQSRLHRPGSRHGGPHGQWAAAPGLTHLPDSLLQGSRQLGEAQGLQGGLPAFAVCGAERGAGMGSGRPEPL